LKLNLRIALFACAVIALAAVSTPGVAQTAAGLKAGAARVDITPAVADLPEPFKTIHDNIYVRVLLLDNGASRSVIVVADAPTIGVTVHADIARRIAAQSHTPLNNVVVAVTHNHNTIRIDTTAFGDQGLLPGSAKIAEMTVNAILEAVKQAETNLRPAKAGYATGTFYLAAPSQQNTDRPAPPPVDRTLGVFKVESVSGEPIAFIVNNGPQPTFGMVNPSEVTSDVAGAAERYVEQRFNDKAVVLYTVGSPPGIAYSPRRSIPGAKPADAYAMMNAVGTILGEEVLATSARIRTTSDVKISAAHQVLQCPGKITTPLNQPRYCSNEPGSKLPPCVFTDKDTGPVDLQIGVLNLGDLALVHADANVNTAVWTKLKAIAPPNTAFVALVYGPMKYVMADADYPSNSYPVTASWAKVGCAEQGFITKAMSMIKETR
jgi:neutral ceramidase